MNCKNTNANKRAKTHGRENENTQSHPIHIHVPPLTPYFTPYFTPYQPTRIEGPTNV